MNKVVQIILFILWFFPACKHPSQDQQKTNTLTIYADTNLSYILDQIPIVYQNIYPDHILKTAYLHEQELIKLFDAKKVDNIILSRTLTENELYAMQTKYQSKIKQYTFAYDAIVAIAANNASFQEYTTALTTNLTFDHEQSGIATVIQKDNPNAKSFRVGTSTAVITYVASHSNTIGFIPFHQIANPYDKSQSSLRSNIKTLPILLNNTTYQISQQSIADKEYPYLRAITLIMEENATLSLEQFSRFIFKDRMAKLILHSGIVPARIPKVQVTVNNKDYKIVE